MRIARLAMENYRSIRSLAIDCQTLTVLIGPNNHGKSNVLSALEFLLVSSSKPVPTDFFAVGAEPAFEFWVEGTFCDLTEQEANTFQRYVGADGTLRIRRTARRSSEGKCDAIYNGWLSEPTLPWLRASAQAVKKDELAPELIPYIPAGVRHSRQAVQDAQQAYLVANAGAVQFEYSLETTPLLGQKTVAAGALPDTFLIPAVRELGEETKIKNTAMFGRLLSRALAEMAHSDPEFTRAREAIRSLVARLNRGPDGADERPQQLQALENSLQSQLRDWGVAVSIDVAPFDVERVFEMGTSIALDDGVVTSADAKGHGLQRALIFALTRAWASSIRTATGDTDLAPRAGSDSMCMLVEEPELYLHPHAQRALASNLKDLARATNHQVFLVTHSPHFVDIEDPMSIAILRKPSPTAGTGARQCAAPLFAGPELNERRQRFNLAQWINPDRSELFFARRVAFVEGATERALVPYVARRLGLFDPEVSVIECGSKFNLPLYMELAGAFGISNVVLHDEDPVPSDLTGDKLTAATRTFALNAEIERLALTTGSTVHRISPDFEGLTGVSKNQGSRKGKPLAALDYFETLPDDKFPTELVDVVRSVYLREV